jgi:ABC-type transporter Mla subunit MlaD
MMLPIGTEAGNILDRLCSIWFPSFPLSALSNIRTSFAGLIKNAKNSDEVAEILESAIKNADEVTEGAGKTGKYIDDTTDALTKAEQQVVDDLVKQGKTVERIPRDLKAIDRTPDFNINNVKTELKTLENANTNTGMKRIQKGFSQGAESVIVDARTSGLTKAQAEEIIARVKGKYPNGRLPGTLEIWIDGQIITYP